MSVPVEFVNDRGNKVEIKDTEARRLASVAQTAAENAQSTATAAGTLAQQAKDIADAASSAASTNAENISTLNGKVTALEGSVSDIEEDIETIKEDYISKEELQSYDILEETDNLPLTFTTNSESLIDYKIYGNSNSNHIDEVTNNLPITIPNAKAGVVEDWTIEGNNIPQVENITKELPITFPSNGDNITDYTIYGNNNPCEPEQTSVLPITFETVENKLRDWSISGNDENGTENYFDKANCGLIQVDTQGTLRFGSIMYGLENGEYTLDCDNQSGRALYLQTLTNGIYTNVNVTSLLPYTFTVQDTDALILRSTTNQETDWDTIGVYNIMLVQGSTAPDHYIPYQKGVGERTKNLLKNTGTTIERNGVTFTKYADGTVMVNGTSTSNGCIFFVGDITLEPDKTYIYTGCPAGGGEQTTYCLYFGGKGADWADFGEGKMLPAVTESTTLSSRIVVYKDTTVENLVFKPMIRLDGTTDTFIPYGYEISLTVSQDGQTDKTFDIYIGENPLTEGETVSKTSTGVDITTQVGENTISTTLYNKPVMYCGKALGVGIPTENLFDKNAKDTENGFIENRYINNRGETSLSSNFSISEYIPIEANTTYQLYYGAGGSNPCLCLCDANKDMGTGVVPYSNVSPITFTTGDNDAYIRISYRNNAIDSVMLAENELPSTYIPYGYKVPITITDENSNTTEQTFYIGNSRLLSGDTYTKTQAGIDIPTTSGNNIISTTLYNKPEMNVVCNSNVLGVGLKSENILSSISADNGWRQGYRSKSNGGYSSTHNNGEFLSPRMSTSGITDFTICAKAISGTNAISVYFFDADNTYLGYTDGSDYTGSTFTVMSGATSFDFAIRTSCNTFEEVVQQGYWVMLVKGLVAPTEYYPYNTYRLPITVMGENLFDTSKNGMIYIDTTNQRYGNSLGKLQAGTYTLSFTRSSQQNLYVTKRIGNTYSQGSAISSFPYTFDIATNVDEVIVRTTSSSSTTWEAMGFANIMVTHGSTAPLTYIPYTATNYTFQLGSRPLAQGQSISKATTHSNITLYSGSNTISTSLNNKPNMFISYQSGELGVGVSTENLFDKNASALVQIDTQGTMRFGVSIGALKAGSYTLSFDKDSSSNYSMWIVERRGTIYTRSGSIASGPYTFTLSADADEVVAQTSYQRVTTWEALGLTNIMLVKGSTAPTNFIPYGYEIPIRVYDGEANTENTNYTDLNFYIGNSLLSADEYIDFINNKIYKYVSSVLTPTNPIVDLPVIPTNGTNTIDTTLYNKPEMYIKYSTDSFSRIFTTTLPTTFINHSDKVKDWIIYGNESGVGEEGNDGYIIPLVVNGNTINIPIGSAALTEGETVSRTSTNIDIPTIDGENTINTTLTNKPTMKITKDFVTKEYIEDVANSCMNDNVEDIVENVVDDKVDKQMFFMFYSSINKNGMFRGKDLTNVYTIDEIYQKVSSGTFDDLYLGDYFTKSITTDIYTKFTGSAFVEGTTYYTRTGTLNNWVYTETEDTSYDSSKTYYTKTTKTENVSLMIAHFNYYYNIGDTTFTNPHIILTNRNYGFATTSKMNLTDTTVGGYYTSEMHQTTLPCYAKSLKTALNNHLLSHKTLLSNAINASTPSMAGAGLTGASSGWAWYDTELQLMTEQQLFGSGIWTSSAYDVGCDGEKLAVFNFVNGVQNGRYYFWLRSVASSSNFACCTNNGHASCNSASSARYVRPLIVFG